MIICVRACAHLCVSAGGGAKSDLFSVKDLKRSLPLFSFTGCIRQRGLGLLRVRLILGLLLHLLLLFVLKEVLDLVLALALAL